jgi:hypothetical protein
MRNYFKLFIVMLVIPLFTLNNCCKDDDEETVKQTEPAKTGHIIFKVAYKVDGDSLEFDKMNYINAAGNHYEVTNIQWFISDVTLYIKGKTSYVIQKEKDYFYFDTGIPTTYTWNVTDNIPIGTYDSVSFIFGFTQKSNIPYRFVNPPESDMFWPEYLGGGYHYMKLNGFWRDTVNFRRAFNFHMGIGRLFYGVDTINIQNYFKVNLAGSTFNLQENQTKEIQLVMNIEEWFKNPYVFNFNFWGGQIMEKPDAMAIARENGKVGVFTVGYIKDK